MDIQLHYINEGEGEPLVLLHGNGEDSSYFAPHIATLKQHYAVYAPDTRGHGRTPVGTAPFTLQQFAKDLATFFHVHQIPAAHIVGFSDGANIALLFALKYPQLVRSMVLAGGNLFPEGLCDDVRHQDAADYEAALRTGDEHALRLLRLMMNEPHIRASDLRHLHQPALVVAGTHDMIKEEHTRLIAQSLPNAQLRFMEGDHFVVYRKAAEFIQLVLTFLDSVH